MDEEMEENNEVEYNFTAVEIDLDYEFDAVRFFDFSREESPAEARQAELWFDTAATYPPSPFVAKLLPAKDVLLENVNTSPKPKHEEDVNLLESDSDIEVDEESSAVDRDDGMKDFNLGGTSANLQSSNQQKFQNQHCQFPSGLTFYNQMMKDNKSKAKSSVKPYVPRISTLMKPTASQLAKQNQPRQMHALRFQKTMDDKNDKSLNNFCGIEIQAAKRQKLEGGHLSKVGDTKQHVNFVHKEPKRDGTVDGNTMLAKLRLTIPREPELETTHRAQRIRPKTGKETQSSTSTVRRFKALPLNRKILEAPSLLISKRSAPRVPEFCEFHLKTSERALQHAAATISVSTASCSNSNKELPKCNGNSTAQCRDETTGCNVVHTSKVQVSELSHNFKALPLNRKILSSKGDIGVFRNSKREITVPMEFNFHTDKRAQHNPPVELFNKLSIASEPHQKIKMPHLPAKGSKENRWDSFEQEHQVKHEVKEKLPPLNEGRKIQFGSNGRKTDGGLVSGISRNLGVR